jgi:hypothetical protein
MFIGTPAPNPLADAFTALATNMGARGKYNLESQNSRLNAMLPSLMANTQLQLPPGATINDLMGMGQQQGPGGFLGAMMGGQGQGVTPGIQGAPWGIIPNQAKALEAQKTQSDIDSNQESILKSQYDRGPGGVIGRTLQDMIVKRDQDANMGMRSRVPMAGALATAAQQLRQQLGGYQSDAPEQPSLGTYTLTQVKALSKKTGQSVNEIIAALKSKGYDTDINA